MLLFNCIRLSHGDKMFTNLIDNLGLLSSYDIDASTNSIAPGSNSKWYLFAIPLFANLNISFNVLTNKFFFLHRTWFNKRVRHHKSVYTLYSFILLIYFILLSLFIYFPTFALYIFVLFFTFIFILLRFY